MILRWNRDERQNQGRSRGSCGPRDVRDGGLNIPAPQRPLDSSICRHSEDALQGLIPVVDRLRRQRLLGSSDGCRILSRFTERFLAEV